MPNHNDPQRVYPVVYTSLRLQLALLAKTEMEQLPEHAGAMPVSPTMREKYQMNQLISLPLIYR